MQSLGLGSGFYPMYAWRQRTQVTNASELLICCDASRAHSITLCINTEWPPTYRSENVQGKRERQTYQDCTLFLAPWPPHFLLGLPDLAPALFAPAGLDPAAFAGPGLAPAAPAFPGLARPKPLRAAFPEPLRFGVPALPDLCARQAR